MAHFTVREAPCKSAINRVQGMPFDWSINPYRGCRHACVYCYARPTHEYLGMNGADEFQEVIFAKTNAPEVVRRELGTPLLARGQRGDRHRDRSVSAGGIEVPDHTRHPGGVS